MNPTNLEANTLKLDSLIIVTISIFLGWRLQYNFLGQCFLCQNLGSISFLPFVHQNHKTTFKIVPISSSFSGMWTQFHSFCFCALALNDPIITHKLLLSETISLIETGSRQHCKNKSHFRLVNFYLVWSQYQINWARFHLVFSTYVQFVQILYSFFIFFSSQFISWTRKFIPYALHNTVYHFPSHQKLVKLKYQQNIGIPVNRSK